ncbi:MAG TPA: protein kinase [Vicinamibacteria bacterium]|nr:protein kinase [Vicinamibacteria bacterium]
MTPRRLGKYEIVAKIGQGAMGEVFRAHDPVLNREVAVKTMTASVGADEDLRKRFHREAQSAARLNHPNIITVYDFGEEQGQIYMAMELLEGRDLKEVIGHGAALTLPEKLSLLDQIADGLAFAHAKDVVHRDLKPANIHILPNGSVKIMDFGLARFSSSDITRAGTIMGTPNYMSPEQVRGEKVGAPSDVFSLGAVFYELLAGCKPFASDSVHAVLFQVLQQEARPLSEVAPEVPEPLRAVVAKALAKDVASRYQNAGELREALRGVRAALTTASDTERGQATDATASPLPGPSRSGSGSPTWPGPAPTRQPASPRTMGAVALDPHPRASAEAFPSQPEATVSGRAETRAAPAVGRSARSGGGRGAVALTAVAVVVLSLGGFVAWRLTQTGAATVATPTPAPTAAAASPASDPRLTLVAQVSDARRSLAARSYREAARRAEDVLAQEASNPDARSVLVEAQSALRQIDEARSQAATALAAGDAEEASRGLSRLRALDPQDQAIPELTGRIEGLLKARLEQVRQAEDRARRAAPAAVASPQAARVQPPPATLPPATLPHPPAPPAPSVMPPPATPPAVPAQSEPAARQAVRGVLEEYRTAFESLNADAIQAVQPSADVAALKANFGAVTAYNVRMQVRSIAFEGPSLARASCLMTYSPVPKPSGKFPPVPTVFHLRRSGEVWLIEKIVRQ